MENPQVFYSYEWALAAYRAYPGNLPPLLFLAYGGDDSLIGVAALAGDSSGHRASFLCATTGDYCDFVSSRDNRAELLASVLAELRKLGIKEITLANLPADSETAVRLRKPGIAERYRVFARTGYICAQVDLKSLERRGDAKPVLPRKKMLRRFLNAMGRDEPVRLDHARSWNAIETVLPDFMQAHIARFLVTGRISNMARPERQRFLQELAKLLAEPGWVAITRMMSGTKTYATNYGFQFHQTWFWYQPTFDSDLEKYSPGFCLLAKLIEEAADNPALQTVDLGLGAEEYKDRFANHSRETLYVTLKSSAWKHYREMVRYRLAALAVRLPPVEQAARWIVERWDRVKKRIHHEGAGGLVRWLLRRLRELLWMQSEVFFYEWTRPVRALSNDIGLQPIDLNVLAKAVTQYVEDRQTLDYLLRSAARLREGQAEGFVLLDSEGRCLHFAWAKNFEGCFLSELNAAVEAPSADSVMLFDCWTPVSVRGRGSYAQAVERVASLVHARGKRPWIFSAATNANSVRGLAETGFQRRYSLWRRRLFGLQWIAGETPRSGSSPTTEVSPQT